MLFELGSIWYHCTAQPQGHNDNGNSILVRILGERILIRVITASYVAPRRSSVPTACTCAYASRLYIRPLFYVGYYTKVRSTSVSPPSPRPHSGLHIRFSPPASRLTPHVVSTRDNDNDIVIVSVEAQRR